MCLAFPAKVKKISEKKIVLNVNGVEKQIKRGMLPVKKGDCVVIHANKVVDKLTEEQYKKYLKELSEL